MASKVENSVDIDRPVGEVFSFVDDFKNTTRYIVGMTQYTATTAQTSGRGARFSMVKKTTGLPDIKSVVEITEWEQDHRIAFESVSGFANSGSYTFTARGERTNVRLVNVYDLATLSSGGGMFGGFKKAALGALSGAAEGQARKDLTTSLDQLKRLVESSPRKAAAAAPRTAPAKSAGGTKAAPKKSAPAAKAAASRAPKAAAKPAAKPASRSASAKTTTPKAAAKPGANGRAASGGKTTKK